MTKAPGGETELGSVLVVDDDAMNRVMLSRLLTREGYAVTEANDGAAALELVDKHAFDLVLLDVMMPGIDGLQVLETLRKTRSVAELPIIMATAEDSSRDVVRALKLGANDYVTKPLDFSVVLARVQTHLSLKRAKEELEATNARMKKDLEAAAKVQRALMPNSLPKVLDFSFVWNFVPCDELGGDILDVFQLDEDNIGLYLLDVSGHGVRAALLSVTLNRLLAQMAEGSLQFEEAGGGQTERQLLSPAEVAAGLNTRFQMDASPGAVQYFTFLYGILNTNTSIFRYVSAGHPGPIQVRTDGKSILHPQEGFAIGWFPDSTYQEFVIELKPGDRLYLYSDGILEAMNSEDELFGPERVVEALEERKNLTLQGSVEELVECGRQWSGVAGFADDVSILALERGVAETP